jgi:SAM-dependent methyltransferase
VQVADFESVLLREADILVVQRHVTGDLASAELLINHCRRNNIKLIYDLDDDLLNIPSSHPEVASLQDLAAIVLRFLLEADAVWVSTPALKARISSIRADAEVIRNRHDERIWRSRKAAEACELTPIRILYMGTATHDAELEFLAPIAKEVVARHGQKVRFEVVGVTAGGLPDSFHRVSFSGRNGGHTYPEFVNWFTRQSWDIALCPLIENTFNECKSAIKLLDYAALRLPVIASTNKEYLKAFECDGGICFVDNDQLQWIEAVSSLVQSEARRLKNADLAHTHYLSNHTLDSNTTCYRHALSRVLNITATNYAFSILKLSAQSSDGQIPVSRELLAQAFLHGKGLEVGALHNPLPLGPAARVRYVDHLDKAGLYEHYPELREFPLVDVDIIDDGERLTTITDESQDFLIANHFLEHTEDPLTTLNNLLRVIRPSGMLFIALPDKRYTFDCDRAVTPLEHLIEDRDSGPAASRDQHFREWVTLVEPHFGRFGPGTPASEIERRIEELKSTHYSIHFHCWTSKEVVELLHYSQATLQYPFRVTFFAEYPHAKENIFILQKLENNQRFTKYTTVH